MNNNQYYEQNLKFIYSHLLSQETDKKWTVMDDYVEKLEYLSDEQLLIESEIIYIRHSEGEAHCVIKHAKGKCVFENLLDAVFIIIEASREIKKLNAKYRYILQYYLAIDQSGIIKYKKI